jgi:hypothetical protein
LDTRQILADTRQILAEQEEAIEKHADTRDTAAGGVRLRIYSRCSISEEEE